GDSPQGWPTGGHRHCRETTRSCTPAERVEVGWSSRWTSGDGKIDEATLDVGVDELNGHAVADIEPVKAPDDASFRRRPRNPNPSPLVRGAGHDALERRSDPRGQQQRCCRLCNLPFDLGRILLLLGAMRGERGEFRVTVGRRPPGERGLHDALRDEIGNATVWRGRMRVILYRKRKVPRRGHARDFESVFA